MLAREDIISDLRITDGTGQNTSTTQGHLLTNALRNILKSYVPGWAFFLFNVLFISFYQNILLYAIATPTYIILLVSSIGHATMTTADLVFARGLMGLILIEFFADQQQWSKPSSQFR